MAVWIVRAGERNVHAGAFVEHGVIAVGWEVIPYDWGPLSSAQILETLLEAGANPDKADSYLDEILDFRDRMAIGDLVVTPEPPAVHIGEITGPDRFRPDSPIDEYRQVRTVTWLGSWPRDQLPEALYRETARRDAINRQQEQAEAWLDLGRRLRAGQGPAAEPARTGGQSRTTSAVRATRAKRTTSPAKVARPKAAAPAQLLCPSCHCRLPATRFSPGATICTDCE